MFVYRERPRDSYPSKSFKNRSPFYERAFSLIEDCFFRAADNLEVVRVAWVGHGSPPPEYYFCHADGYYIYKVKSERLAPYREKVHNFRFVSKDDLNGEPLKGPALQEKFEFSLMDLGDLCRDISENYSTIQKSSELLVSLPEGFFWTEEEKSLVEIEEVISTTFEYYEIMSEIMDLESKKHMTEKDKVLLRLSNLRRDMSVKRLLTYDTAVNETLLRVIGGDFLKFAMQGKTSIGRKKANKMRPQLYKKANDALRLELQSYLAKFGSLRAASEF